MDKTVLWAEWYFGQNGTSQKGTETKRNSDKTEQGQNGT